MHLSRRSLMAGTASLALAPGVAGAAGGLASVHTVATREEAVAWVRSALGPGDVVLYENDLPDHHP